MAKSKETVKLSMRRHILNGSHPIPSAILSGISRQTYQRWCTTDESFKSFIEECEAEDEANVVKLYKKAAIDTKNVNGLRDYLERRFSDRWSPKQITELQGANGQSVVFKVDMSGGYLPPEAITSTVNTTITPKPEPS